METLPNNTSGNRLFMSHTLDIPPCCPVSGNPLPGSTLTISYRAHLLVLEVIALRSYVNSFVGGLRGPDGNIDVRDMEGLILRVAHDCADAVGVPVKVRADLRLRPAQRMSVVARSQPSFPDSHIPSVANRS